MITPTVRLTEDVPQRGVRHTGATLLHPDRGLRVTDDHLRVRLSAPHPMPLLADVLVAEVAVGTARAGLPMGPQPVELPLGTASVGLPPAEFRPYEDPVRYAARLADCHPGALVVAVYRDDRCWLRLGGRARLLVREPAWPAHSWAVWASVAHVWLVAGLDPDALDPAAVRVLGTVRGYSPASPPAPPDGPGAGSGASASARSKAVASDSTGSKAASRADASSASADRDRPTEEYRDSASR